MPKTYPFQNTFEAGELSPYVYGRSDLPGYRKGATFIENFIPNSRGPLLSRKGLEYREDVGHANDDFARIFPFRVSYETTYIVAVSETYIWITDQDAIVESDNLLSNGHFDDGDTDWTSVTANNGTTSFASSKANLVSAAEANSSAKIKQTVTGLNTSNTHKLRLEATVGGGGPGAFNNPGKIKVGTTDGGSDLLNITGYGGGNVEYEFAITASTIYVEIECVSVQYEWPPDTGFGWYGFTLSADLVLLTDLVTASGTPVTFTSPYTKEQIPDLQVDMAPDLQEMVFVHRDVSPRVLEWDDSTNPATWTFNAITFTPADPFGNSEYPGAVTFHQGRLILASTATKPATIFLSKPGRADYYDFSKGLSDSADDGMEVTLARNADIQWVQGGKVLYVGCDNSEHILRSDGAILTPMDVEAVQQSVYGSARIQNTWISENVSFISHDQRRVRLIDYDANTRGVTTPDLAWAAHQITNGLISEIHHAPNPENILWFVTADGNLLSCTYNNEYPALAWARHSVDVGVIQSACIAEELGRSVLYAMVYRDSDLKLCRLTDDDVFMDEFIQRGYGTATNSVDGLDHLNGETVQVIADGTQRDDETVSSGSITISGAAANTIYVGLQLSRTVQTMIVDSANTYGGSTAAFKKRWSEIYLRLNNSVFPKINMKRETALVPDANTDILATGTNEIVDMKVQNLGWDGSGIILIEEDLPFPVNIISLFGRLSEEAL